MEPPLTVALSIVLGIIALLVSISIFTAVAGPELGLNRTAETDKTIDILHRLVTVVGQPDITYAYAKQGGEYQYTVLVNSVNLKSNEDVNVFPVMNFKGKHARLDAIELDANQLNGFSAVEPPVQITSRLPPMKVLPGGQNSIDAVSETGQRYFIKNYVVEITGIYQFKIKIRFAPDLALSDCTVSANVECKTGNKRVELSLKDEEKPCSEQADVTKCKKNYNMCDGEINIELVEFQEPDKECKFSKPLIHIDVPREAEEWQTGEELEFTFWRVPENPAYNDCWQKNLANMDKGCFDHLVGASKVTILKEYLPE